jgi:hypothetical protein
MQGQHAQRGNARGKNGGLGVFRQPEVCRRPLEDQLGNRKAQSLVGLGEGIAGNGKAIGKFAAHANRLRTLPRKKKGNFDGHVTIILPEISGSVLVQFQCFLSSGLSSSIGRP